ncbi:hypothetical protein [Nocardia sp. NBC_00416]
MTAGDEPSKLIAVAARHGHFCSARPLLEPPLIEQGSNHVS